MLVAALAGGFLLALIAGFLAANSIQSKIEVDHPPSGEFVDVDGTRLHLRQTGPRNREPILVLHGAASNMEEPYSALAETLKDDHVLWLDRPGLGWSDRPDIEWSPREEAELITRLLDTLNIQQVLLIGHSWGGAIAMRLALDHPDRVSGLVLIAPALGAWIGDAAWFNKASFWPVVGPLFTRLLVPLTGKPNLRSGAVNAFHPEPVPEGYAEATRLALLLRTSNWLANARDMADVNRHLEQQEPHYHKIEHRTVFLAGKGDTVLWSHRHSGLTASRMKNAELRWIKGAGHNLHHHQQDAVAAAIADVRAD